MIRHVNSWKKSEIFKLNYKIKFNKQDDFSSYENSQSKWPLTLTLIFKFLYYSNL